ncbi:hypothetical protein GLOTRDRAFT_93163 [Gloeophyllum trabeum ATCC 11539]|uniref:Uncharacterized protein n=1 Tax=Gloeophyllum trabeum (strain ATCC 11539 / FP-39264 / Madison 617) TaxID=670483 RepID=S7Q7X0_GLOTA|nr:uncharacterized protein GLOTRDRAFT_93163 [Gloeophyllum trabeum ATCC 11539]EPQ55538.1 hypothetical protein GLOTRDRAFT_93163 [Gloeophyllum trabeum ATCC 11539]
MTRSQWGYRFLILSVAFKIRALEVPLMIWLTHPLEGTCSSTRDIKYLKCHVLRVCALMLQASRRRKLSTRSLAGIGTDQDMKYDPDRGVSSLSSGVHRVRRRLRKDHELLAGTRSTIQGHSPPPYEATSPFRVFLIFATFYEAWNNATSGLSGNLPDGWGNGTLVPSAVQGSGSNGLARQCRPEKITFVVPLELRPHLVMHSSATTARQLPAQTRRDDATLRKVAFLKIAVSLRSILFTAILPRIERMSICSHVMTPTVEGVGKQDIRPDPARYHAFQRRVLGGIHMADRPII